MIGKLWRRIIGRTPEEHLELVRLRLRQVRRGLVSAELRLIVSIVGTNKEDRLKKRIVRLTRRVKRWEKIVASAERFVP